MLKCNNPSTPPPPNPPPEQHNRMLVDEALRYMNFTDEWWGRKTKYPGYRSGQCSGNCLCYQFKKDSPNDEYYGVAYSFGNKDTPEDFFNKISSALNPQNNVDCKWGKYKAYKPGLHSDEYWYYRNNITSWVDSLKKWAGIDCSGLVQRCAYAAKPGSAIDIPYIGGFNEFGGELSISQLKNRTTVINHNNWNEIWNGDIVFYPSHVVIISDKGTSQDDAYVIHSCGAFGFRERSVRCDRFLRLVNTLGNNFEIRRFNW